jgi:type IV pilus assembly protein PilE
MTVMAIVAILASVAYPSYQESVRKAKRAEGRAALLQLIQHQERYYSLHGRYIAFSSESTDLHERQFRWYSGDSPRKSAYEISGAACRGEALDICVVLTASPGTGKVDAGYEDPKCGKLIVFSTGKKAADGNDCW